MRTAAIRSAKSIRPTFRRTVVALILGGATTVVVASSLAMLVDGGTRSRWNRGFHSVVASQAVPTPLNSPQEGGTHVVQVARSWRWGTEIVEVWPAWSEDPDRPPVGSPHDLVRGTSFAAEMKEKFDRREAPCAWWRADGWPLPALSAEARWSSYDALRVSNVIGGVLVGSRNVLPGDGVRILPLQLIWSGFVVDTLLYATLWLALLSIRDVRSRLRRAHGKCACCGYTLVPTQTRCSECGKGVDTAGSEAARVAP